MSRGIVAVFVFAFAVSAFGQEYDTVVPETPDAFDSSVVEPAGAEEQEAYNEDGLPYETADVDQSHVEQMPVQTTRLRYQDAVTYEPETVTKQVPTEVWYTKPIEEKTTDSWTNETDKEMIPYWKKVTMSVNVTIPIPEVHYKKMVKLVAGNETVLKKVFVPRTRVEATGSAAAVAPAMSVLEFPKVVVNQNIEPDDEAVYAKDQLPYETGTVEQTHTVQAPVETTRYVPQDVESYRPETVTREVPTEVWYTKPVEEKTTTKWTNETDKVLVPYWKKVVMTINATIPVNLVKYNKVVKLVEGNETDLKKVFVPRSEVTDKTGSKKAAVDTNSSKASATVMPLVDLGLNNVSTTTSDDDETTTVTTLPGPLAFRKEQMEPQRTVVQRPVIYREMVPESVVHYEPEQVVEHVKVPLPSWEKKEKTYRNVTSWAPEEYTIRIVKPVLLTYWTQDLKWVDASEMVKHVTVTRGTDPTHGRHDDYLTFHNGGDEAVYQPPTLVELEQTSSGPVTTSSAGDEATTVIEGSATPATTTTYTTLPGPLAYQRTQDREQKVVEQRPVYVRQAVPQEEVHYVPKKVTEHVKVPLPSWVEKTQNYRNVTSWEPVQKTLHIVKPVSITFMTEDLKWVEKVVPEEHVTVTRGDDEDADSAHYDDPRYVDYSSGDAAIWEPNETELYTPDYTDPAVEDAPAVEELEDQQ
jgi:hypothetical protein